MAGNYNEIEKRLWDAADQLRANSHLKSSEYSIPVLGLIFLRYADHKFFLAQKGLEGRSTGRRTIGRVDYQAQGVVYLPENSRFSYLLKLPEGANIGKAVNEAMRLIEEENEDLRGVLPKNYGEFDNDLLVALLKNFSEIFTTIEGDVFGKIYEYFLGKFAIAEGAKGGEYFTPTSIVRLIVENDTPSSAWSSMIDSSASQAANAEVALSATMTAVRSARRWIRAMTRSRPSYGPARQLRR